ncbi:MAG: FecR family protein [Candidatus Omnitrophica bacterium]|nr:FecR family protein [Candidatus Omnitrophota bacterium]
MIKKNSKTLMLISVALFFTLLLPVSGMAAEVGKVMGTTGRVDIFRSGSDGAIVAGEGDPVSVGDSIRTKSNSKAEIEFFDKSILRIAESSKVDIAEYTLDTNNRRKAATIKLERGKARTIIAKMPDAADFNILTPNAEGMVKGSDIFTFYQAGSSGMLVAEGKLSVVNLAHPEEDLVVPAGKSVLVPLEEKPQGPRTYMEIEKKMHEMDTDVPRPVESTGEVSVIKGMIAKFSGDVKITNKDLDNTHKAQLMEVVKEGDIIETGENGLVEIRLDNDNAVNLKPKSKIKIIRLIVNPVTGEYENIFEVTIGSVRARVENLKGNSKFEIKTPTAVCGARGTIIVVQVSPNITMLFFEGGAGFLTNTLSGTTTTVGPGMNAFSNDSGVVSNPVYTPEGLRQMFSEGWTPGGGLEGYSSPEGTMVYLFDPNVSGDSMPYLILDPDSLLALQNELAGLFVNLPFDMTTLEAFFLELMASDKFLEGIGSGTLKALGEGEYDIGTIKTEDIIDGKRSESEEGLGYGSWFVTMAGSYQLDAGYTTSDVYSWTLDVAGLAKDVDRIDGCWFGKVEGTNWVGNIMQGKLKGIYLGLSPDGEISGGTIGKELDSGIILGTYAEDPFDNSMGTWGGAGGGEWVEEIPILNTMDLSTLDAGIQALASSVSIPINIVYGPINMAGSGSFTTGGAISATMDMNLYGASAAAQNGIWAAIIQGSFSPPSTPSDTWSVDVSDGSYVATLQGTQWSNGQWRADVVNGVGPNNTTFEGAATGQYCDVENTLNGAGVGEWKSDGGALE